MRKFKEHLFIFFFIAISIFILISVTSHENNLIPVSYKGMIVYNEHMDKQNQLLYLNCNWIYSDKNGQEHLVYPDSVLSSKGDEPINLTLYISLEKPEAIYGIIVPQLNSSYQLFLDDKLIKATGIYDNTIRKSEYLDCHYFHPTGNRVKLTLNIEKANNAMAFSDYFIFGNAIAIKHKYLATLLPDIICIVVLIVASLYFSMLSYYDRKHKEYLSFTAVCVGYSIRLLLGNTCVFSMLFDKVPYFVTDTLYVILSPLLAALILYHIYNMLPGIISKKILYAQNGICIGAIIINLFPYEITAMASYYVFVFVSQLIVLTILCASIIAIVKRIQSGKFILISSLLFIYANMLDMISLRPGHIYTYSLSICMIFFILGQTVTFLDKAGSLYRQEMALSKSYRETLSNMHTEETNFLSSHLKPHFLFNALNIISGYALFEPEIARKVTDALIIYLKQLFEHDNLNEMNSLENELALVKAFGYIECQRFPDITINYELDYKTENIKIPALILQPLLENAVNHGIRKQKKAVGTVTVSICEKDNYIHFAISDDGLGMNVEDKINALSKPEDDKFHSLYHLQLRLKELYKETLVVTTEAGNGTEIHFKIPVSQKVVR